MKIALVHDHLAQNGGAENVLRAFLEIWPDAPVYVVVYDKNNTHKDFQKYDIRTSFLQKWPFGIKKYQWYVPLMPTAVESYDLSEYDVVLSTVSAFAKGVITKPETLHVTYCHTPTRYLWSDTHSYVGELGVPRFVKRGLSFILSYLRTWDRVAADRPHTYIANSKTIQYRIQNYYKRDSSVIYPPVHTQGFTVAKKEDIGDYFLAGGRLVPYKRFDLLVEAFNRLGLPLKIFGDGPVRKELEKMAKPNVEILGRVPEPELKKLYSECAAFLNPQEEDFGITMIEAMAAGRPVVAYAKGGAKEIVEHGKTGLLIEYQTWQDFADAMIGFDKHQFDVEAIRAKALTFEHEQFKKKIQEFVEKEYEEFHNKLP